MKQATDKELFLHWTRLWLEGEQLQYLHQHQHRGIDPWRDMPLFGTTNYSPAFFNDRIYRVKPREFENGAFYPVLRLKYPVLRLKMVGSDNVVPDVVQYYNGGFYLTGVPNEFKEVDFKWIGEALDLSLWDKDNGKT